MKLSHPILMVAILLPVTAHAAESLNIWNNRLDLSIDLALDGGHCRLTDKATGEVYEARDFGVIRAWDITEDRMRTLIISSDSKTSRCDIEIEVFNETRAILHVDTGPGSPSAMGQMSFGIAFDVELTLKGNTLEYAIPIASLREQAFTETVPQRWRLMNVELFPHLGATPAGRDGYLIIPSWSGALYYFDRNHPRANKQFTKPGYGDLGTEAGLSVRWNFRPEAPTEYGSMMYGIQAAWEDQLQQPIYATIRGKGGLMGLLMSGEYDAELRARRDQGPDRTASINPILHYRKGWHSKLDPVDRRVRLIALDSEQANYSAVGNIYRDFVIDERGVKPLRQRAQENPDVAYFMDSIYVRFMMGMKKSSMDGSGEMHSYQSWDDVANAIRMFQEAGFKKANFILVGANFEGHDGAHPTVFPLEKTHGGEDGLKRMIKVLDAANYRAGLHLNYKDVYTCSPDWDPSFIQINEYGELRYHGAWIGGYSYQGIPQEMLERFGQRDLPKLRAIGLHGLHYWDACLSVMEETFPPNRVITRREYGEGAIGYFKYAAKIFGAVGCETTIAPLLGVMVNAGNTSYPNGGASAKFPNNGYCESALLDHWVPLEHIIYHGLTCYGGGPETAGRTGTEFNGPAKREQVEQLYERYQQALEWNEKSAYAFITDHRMIAPMIFRTTLSDDTRIWVNKTKEDWSGNGVTVKAKGHVLKRGS